MRSLAGLEFGPNGIKRNYLKNSNDEKETKFKVLINVLTSYAAKLLKVIVHGSRVVLLRSS